MKSPYNLKVPFTNNDDRLSVSGAQSSESALIEINDDLPKSSREDKKEHTMFEKDIFDCIEMDENGEWQFTEEYEIEKSSRRPSFEFQNKNEILGDDSFYYDLNDRTVMVYDPDPNSSGEFTIQNMNSYSSEQALHKISKESTRLRYEEKLH